ncbi:hypothetical protein D3C72_1642320 [compost metagenome]
MAIAHQRPHGAPHGGFLSYYQCHRPEVRQTPCLGHAQAEVVYPAGDCRGLEQAPDGIARNPQVGIVQAGRTQSHLGQQGQRIEPRRTRHLGVVGQAGAANQIRHGVFTGVSR